jgi:DNA-binding transcriptional ArsR family regulator
VARRTPPRNIELTEPDLELLRFLAEHRMVLAEHAAALLDRSISTARSRLNRLAAAGYVRSDRLLQGRPRMYLITRPGLKVIGSRFEPPHLDMLSYRHDVGVAWLWLAARHGTFGPLAEVIAERRLRSHDATREAETEPLGVRTGGVGPRGQESLHYPDLLLRTEDGRRIGLELELSGKERTRIEKILLAYGADPRIDGVVYLVEKASVARSVTEAARRLGVSSRVHIQRVRFASDTPSARPARTLTRAAPRRRDRADEVAL